MHGPLTSQRGIGIGFKGVSLVSSRARLARLRTELSRRELDAMVVTAPVSIRYLCGFSGTNALLVVKSRSALFVTDPRYTEQSRCLPRNIIRRTVLGSLLEGVARLGFLKGCHSLGIEEDSITLERFRQMRRAFSGVSLCDTYAAIECLASVKEKVEIAALSKAAEISDAVFKEIVPLIRPGVTEVDIADEITCRQRNHGAEKDAFDPIVAAGDRSAQPHARATACKIRRGDSVVMDFGCTVQGYGSDLTRTVVVGLASARFRAMYETVLRAREEAVGKVREGVEARVVDAAARTVITRRGFGRYFVHSLGHGLGLSVHERPRLSPTSADILQDGNVLTIEPGIYIPGYCGVRIEDDIVVRRTGCTLLTKSPRELVIL
jgi:Xaa-Pro aminopeptidase